MHLFLLFSAVAIGPSGTYSSNSPASPLSSASLTSPLSPFSLISGSQGSPTKPGPSEVSELGCASGALGHHQVLPCHFARGLAQSPCSQVMDEHMGAAGSPGDVRLCAPHKELRSLGSYTKACSALAATTVPACSRSSSAELTHILVNLRVDSPQPCQAMLMSPGV